MTAFDTLLPNNYAGSEKTESNLGTVVINGKQYQDVTIDIISLTSFVTGGNCV